MGRCIRLFLPIVLGALVCTVSTATAAHSSGDACRAGTKRAVIGGKVKCLKAGQVCQARYQAAYKKAGFTCTAGHLRKRKVTPPPQPEPPTPTPPPTPAPPPAQVGHYKGTTSQLTVIEFDVNAGSTAVVNLSTGQVNQGCTPQASLYGGGIGQASTGIASDGTFKIEDAFQTKVGDDPATGTFKLTGQFSGATATGTLSQTTNFTHEGVAYACGSGLQTWTASRVG